MPCRSHLLAECRVVMDVSEAVARRKGQVMKFPTSYNKAKSELLFRSSFSSTADFQELLLMGHMFTSGSLVGQEPGTTSIGRTGTPSMFR